MSEEKEVQNEKAKLVLIVGKHGYIVENVQRIVKGLGYDTVIMLEEYEDLIRRMLKYDYDLLIVVGSVEPHLSEDIVKSSKESKPNAKILVHHGGPATIPSEIKEILN